MDPASQALIVRSKDNSYVAAITLITYDYLLTLPTEIQYVWGSQNKLSLGVLLFFFIRYLPFIDQPFLLWENLAVNPTQGGCVLTNYWSSTSTYLSFIVANIVTGLRTWGIWNRSRIGGVLIFLCWLTMAVMVVVYGMALGAQNQTIGTDSPTGGCTLTDTPATYQATLRAYGATLAYEFIIFVATAVQGVRYLSPRAKFPKITWVLYRDAFVASMCLLAVGLVNYYYLATNSSNNFDTWDIARAFSAIFPARIILNLKEAALGLDDYETEVMLCRPFRAKCGEAATCRNSRMKHGIKMQGVFRTMDVMYNILWNIGQLGCCLYQSRRGIRRVDSMTL